MIRTSRRSFVNGDDVLEWCAIVLSALRPAVVQNLCATALLSVLSCLSSDTRIARLGPEQSLNPSRLHRSNEKRPNQIFRELAQGRDRTREVESHGLVIAVEATQRYDLYISLSGVTHGGAETTSFRYQGIPRRIRTRGRLTTVRIHAQ